MPASLREQIEELVPWADNPPDDDHARAVQALGAIWERDADLGRRIAQFRWVTDGMALKETRSLFDFARLAEMEIGLARYRLSTHGSATI